LLRVPCRLPCRQLIVKERIQLVLNFTLCLRDWTLMTLAYIRGLSGLSFMRVWSSICCLFLHLLSLSVRFLGQAHAGHER
jgi:hypothetical protein